MLLISKFSWKLVSKGVRMVSPVWGHLSYQRDRASDRKDVAVSMVI